MNPTEGKGLQDRIAWVLIAEELGLDHTERQRFNSMNEYVKTRRDSRVSEVYNVLEKDGTEELLALRIAENMEDE